MAKNQSFGDKVGKKKGTGKAHIKLIRTGRATNYSDIVEFDPTHPDFPGWQSEMEPTRRNPGCKS